MKNAVVFGLLLGAAAISQTAFAYTSPGSPDGYVNDFAHVLSVGSSQSLENELTLYERSSSNEITVVTIPNMGGDYIENYAVKLFEEWGIGKKAKDNGILLLLSIEERKMRIEVGYGLEGILPDSMAQRILVNEMTPRLKAGDYDGAISAGVTAIELVIQGEYMPTETSTAPDAFMNALQNGAGIFAAFVFIFQFIISFLARSKSWWAGGVIGFVGSVAISWVFAPGIWATVAFIGLFTGLGLLFDFAVSSGYERVSSRGIRGSGWFGGSGRGGGFGGGSSGGGGASGGW
ncbi:MAG: hypothetical protein JWN18_144 [Parcubacteria group bacterium]|nr:hypothetical protein [Parcubacteria group bacterium]